MEDKIIKGTLKRQVLTPDAIAAKLFSMDTKAEYFHLQTISYAQHKMLDGLYSSIAGLKDSICEYLLGVQAPKRFGILSTEQPGLFNDQTLSAFLQEGFDFSVTLCTYAKEHNLEQLCNLSSELQGAFSKAKYLNTLK